MTTYQVNSQNVDVAPIDQLHAARKAIRQEIWRRRTAPGFGPTTLAVVGYIGGAVSAGRDDPGGLVLATLSVGAILLSCGWSFGQGKASVTPPKDAA